MHSFCMKKLIVLASLLLLMLSLSAASVSVGFEAGADCNMIISGKGYRNYEYTWKAGFTSSIPVIVEFTPSLSLETGFSYSFRNYGYSRTSDDNIKTLDYTADNSFLELPLAFRYTYTFPDSSWSLFASFGGFVGWWLTGRRYGKAYTIDITPSLKDFNQETDLSNYNRFQSGVTASLGVKLKLDEKTDGTLRVGYSLALTDLHRAQKYGAYPVHNSTFSLVGGLMWRCGK